MARIYREPTFNNQFKSSAASGVFVSEKAFDPSKQIREEAKRKAANIKSLQRNQQRQAAVNEANFNASVAKGNASFAKTKAILSFAQSGLSAIDQIQKQQEEENKKNEGLNFLKPELGASIIDETPNKNLEEVADYESELTSKNVDIVKSAKNVEPNDVKLQEEIIFENSNAEASRSSSQISTYTAAASLETDLQAFLESDTKIQLADGTVIVAKDATVDQLPAVIDVGLDAVTKSYFPNELSGEALYSTYIPKARTVHATLLNKVTKEKIALAQELRVLEHTDLATVQLDEGQPASFVLPKLSKKLFTTGAYDSENEAFEAGFNHLSNYYRANQDIEGAAALLNVYKVVNDDGSVNTGTKLANDPVYSLKVMDLMQNINNDIKNIKTATIAGFEKDMFEKLSGVNDPTERIKIVGESIQILKDAGYYEAANNLSKEIEALRVPDVQKIEDANIFEQVVMGEITSKEVLDKQLKLGVISKSGYDKAIQQLDNKNPTIPDGAAKNYVDDVISGKLDDFKIRIGAEVNPFGEVLFPTDAGYLDNASDRSRIIAAVELDLRKISLTTYKLHKDKGEGTVIAEMDKALTKYYKDQFLTEGGKYYVEEFANDNTVDPDVYTKKLQKLLGSSENLTRAFGSRDTSLKPVRFDFNAGDQITLESVATFNALRGDTIFKKDTHKVFVENYKNSGTFEPVVMDAAAAVGMTPLEFLNKQNTNHGLPQFYRPQKLSTEKPNYLAATDYFLNSGLSAKAAKMFSGNFNESTWNNYDNSNVFLSRDTSFTEDSLINIIGAIEANPDIFNIAKNPYATDRQLLNAASFIFN
tara:strand:+ start:3414 stop:5867 length:2454 start_codon:yes stop_codon:yes gene_type:complete